MGALELGVLVLSSGRAVWGKVSHGTLLIIPNGVEPTIFDSALS